MMLSNLLWKKGERNERHRILYFYWRIPTWCHVGRRETKLKILRCYKLFAEGWMKAWILTSLTAPMLAQLHLINPLSCVVPRHSLGHLLKPKYLLIGHIPSFLCVLQSLWIVVEVWLVFKQAKHLVRDSPVDDCKWKQSKIRSIKTRERLESDK